MEDLQNMQNQNMPLVLSFDAKPRLKWTPQLHQQFLDAVNQLGGADKATPKSLMRVMGIPGLTLIFPFCLWLQKFRLGKSQKLEAFSDKKLQEDYSEILISDNCHWESKTRVGAQHQNQIIESLHIAQSLQMQMEAHTKLHEQIEVQRHLQIRIEAQGNYLQSVLRKAQEALAKAETMCSLESSLTSSESHGRKEESTTTSVELPLMAIHHQVDEALLNGDASERKRNGGTVYDGQRCGNRKRKSELLEMLDLNRQYESDIDSNSEEAIELN
ncbi:myb family transcription factor PHL8-like [Senna tora]|uniref:Myb family transcription factor PHL8-like n=1 Tax=Senna tora TaxID=362788 RepID=A0A834STG3_9FABA|nr:myb family transcription factor PHL8-like [Senna tora]